MDAPSTRVTHRWVAVRGAPTKVGSMPVIDFDPPDRFVAGTVGPPGQRTFFLQASEGPRVTSVSLEKQQVVVLADRVNDLLDDFAGGEAADEVAAEVEDNAPLDTPIEDEFRVGTMSLGWDAERHVVILECHDGDETVELDEDGDPVIVDEDAEDRTIFRVVIRPSIARAFARRAAPSSSRPGAHPARSAADHLTPPDTSAHARTATSADRGPPPSTEAEAAELLELLTLGELELGGQLVDASNLALLARLERHGVETRVMYKPVRGERPLWDFPGARWPTGRRPRTSCPPPAAGTSSRPRCCATARPAAARCSCGSRAWTAAVARTARSSRGRTVVDLVPRGKVEPGWLPVFEAELHTGEPVVVVHADRPDLAGVAVLDVVINNADRKGSHLVLDRRGSLWGFDHGLSFHEELKLRTVLWGWAGAPLPDVELSRLDGRASSPSRRPPPAAWRRLSSSCSRHRPSGVAATARARGRAAAHGPVPAARQPVARRPVAAAVTRPL